MGRIRRLRLADVPQHVIQRGNNREAIFFASDDNAFYLRRLQRAAARHGCAVHAYVLMTNHVHLLVTPRSADAISLLMRDLGRTYAQYINSTYGRSGTLWEGRFKSFLVDAERYFFACCRYIELNPVRAGLVTKPEEYRWSSYGFNALGRKDPLLSAHQEYQALGSDPAARQQAYEQLFAGCLDERTLAEVRGAVNRGWPLGSQSFKNQIEATLQRAARPPKRGRPSIGRSDLQPG